MKKLLSILLAALVTGVVFGHDHVEVHEAAGRLQLFGPGNQTAVYVPRGEPFSFYLEDFPGGWHASELTFTNEMGDADPRIELVSVSGPAGGSFAFWEVGALVPTWSRSAGWNSGSGNVPSFPVVFNGDTHAHGRAFTMDKPGDYKVNFRAVDSSGSYAASANLTIVFRAQQPPQLSISIIGGNATLAFTSRANFVYDLQRCEDLATGNWSNVETNTFLDGNGAVIPMTDPISGRGRAFYRLVEYY
jgi:hypothetical protein